MRIYEIVLLCTIKTTLGFAEISLYIERIHKMSQKSFISYKKKHRINVEFCNNEMDQ